MANDTRQRLLEASAQLFREQGYAGTGLKQITTAGGAPWGSLYHFFPGGKEQLGVEAIAHSGARYERLFELTFARAGEDIVQCVRDFFQLSMDALENSEWGDGCPIATVAMEVASTSEPLRHACAEVFSSWEAAFARGLEGAGIPRERAEELATYALAAFEGAIVLSRTAHDTRALRITADLVAATVRAHLPDT
ncbi:TetR/AcrR family transcriptional regulator [Spirillospora sp. NPDC048911]|uniref:TetR/AcrR family transcriptional regulator n=1 Tax=Spirillospora sp. NPDC048911 TaxID=3364527 RepID=UPI003720CA7F